LEFFSLATGSEVKAHIKDKSEGESLFCEFAFESSSKCVLPDYNEDFRKTKVDNSTGLVKCDITKTTETCKYDGWSDKQCRCGFNPTGQAYCPVPPARQQKGWKKMMSVLTVNMNNECHSNNRYTCYKTKDNVYDDYKYYENESQNYDLYYGADSCVKEVLSSSAFNYSFYVLAVVIAFLF